MKKFLISTFAVALVALAPAAFAGTDTKDLNLSVTVVNNCTLATTAVAFPNYDPLSGAADNGSGTVAITCTKNAATTITLGNGLNFSSPNRQMSDGGTQTMTYEIYQPQGGVCNYSGATRWGTTGAEIFTPAAAPSKAQRTYNVCGQIAAGQDVAAGAFADTVVATVNF